MPVELIHGDCMSYMATLPDKAFELAIVDPPYGIGECGATNHSRGMLAVAKDYKPFSGFDLAPPSIEYIAELRRVSEHQILFGANHYSCVLPFASPCWIVWDKENGATDFADVEMAWASFKTAARLFRFRWHGMLQGDMAHKEQRIHPTQKPVALYRWLLHNYAKPGWRILDTHLGSGSSAIAAHEMGFDFVGIEIDADYIAAARKRFDLMTRQIALDL